MFRHRKAGRSKARGSGLVATPIPAAVMCLPTYAAAVGWVRLHRV